MNRLPTLNATITPGNSLNVLSRDEVSELAQTDAKGLHETLRQCALAVLNTGSDIDEAGALLEMYPDFEISVIQQDRGIKLQINNAPTSAFVDGVLINGIRDLLFEVSPIVRLLR